MAAFVIWELRTPNPLLRLRIFSDRGFAVENLVLGLISIVFVPFFFASVYAQVSLHKDASNAGLYLMYFFIGSVLGAVGCFLLAGRVTNLSLGAQAIDVVLAGGGLGLMLGTASTDAVNRAPSDSYSEVTEITQTSRNFGASLGLAVLGLGSWSSSWDECRADCST
jgi:Kef-type K+ transport system membrane component KefB